MNTGQSIAAVVAVAVIAIVVSVLAVSPLLASPRYGSSTLPIDSTTSVASLSTSTSSTFSSTSTSLALVRTTTIFIPTSPSTTTLSTSTKTAKTSSSTTTTASDSGVITIYASRVPSPYWAACFATICSTGTGPGATMYFALYNSSGSLVTTAFANENGYNFTGLNLHSMYYVYPNDCDYCHNSPHNVVFSHWGNGNTTRPLEVAVGSSLNAWFVFVPLNITTTSSTVTTSSTGLTTTINFSSTESTQTLTNTTIIASTNTSTNTTSTFNYVASQPDTNSPTSRNGNLGYAATIMALVVTIGGVVSAKKSRLLSKPEQS
ncbi:MAG: hypothetical protein ACYC7D_14590 [Nitrososphaerales archaeon]